MSELDRVRGELRRLGYLNHGVERFLLQDALRRQRPLRALAVLALKVGIFTGGGLATAGAVALTAVNGNLTVTPFDLLPLFLHLVVPAVALCSLLFLLLGGSLALVLRLYPVRRIEPLSFSVAVAVGLAGVAVALVAARRSALATDVPGWQLALLGAATLVAAWGLIKIVHHGLLSLAIRWTDHVPRQRIFSRRGVGAVVVVALVLLMLPAVMASRTGPPSEPPALPIAPGERVLLIGVDGVVPSEMDYLLGPGHDELPALSGLLEDGGVVLSYLRQGETPATLWTTIATGQDSAVHGVGALDSFRPVGVATPLSRLGISRGYWQWVAVPLGLAEYRPLLSYRRRAFALWELASRGGTPVLAVNWWSTFPAADLPGEVVAHDAYQLLKEGARGAVAPASRVEALAPLARSARAASLSLVARLPVEARQPLLERALRADAFYRSAFEQGLARQPRAAALYLPGLDLAADGWSWGDVAFTDLLRAELAATDRLVSTAIGEFGTVVVVFDPGRREPMGEGRVLLWRRRGCSPSSGDAAATLDLRSLAAGLLRATGLPQSAELPEPPSACQWSDPPTRVESYGRPRSRRQPVELGKEYLEGLQSLGYL